MKIAKPPIDFTEWRRRHGYRWSFRERARRWFARVFFAEENQGSFGHGISGQKGLRRT